jgi:hypothetical protein
VTNDTRSSDAHVRQFRDDGYVLVREPVLAPADFERLKTHFEGKLSVLPAGARPEGMDVPHFIDNTLFQWLLADEVLDLVEPLLGPDLALFSSHFICKPGGTGLRVPWHEDSAYWNDMLAPMEVATVWLAIDASTMKNGCMQVIPGSHKLGGYSDYGQVDGNTHVFDTEIVAEQIDESQAVAFELEPNQASIHDGRIIHGSAANTSPNRRCGYTMRYISAATRFDHDKHPHHQIYLARGKDRAGNRYADPETVYSDFLRDRLAGNSSE